MLLEQYPDGRLIEMEERPKIPQHFTASAVVIWCDHILLVHHKRIGAWLPPGGHIEPFEMPHEAAVREVLEETGVAVEVVVPSLPRTTGHKAFFLPLPLCFQAVNAVEKGEELYHLDLAYLCRPISAESPGGLSPDRQTEADELPEIKTSADVKEARWVRLSELDDWQLAANVPEIIELARSHLILSFQK